MPPGYGQRSKRKLQPPKRRPVKGRGSRKRVLWALIILAGAGILLFYGPFEQFRLLWINTAMYSSRYKFLATVLYSPAYIASVLEQNRGGAQGQTSPEPLRPREDAGEDGGPGDGFIFAEVKGNYYRGYLVKLANPARLSLVRSPQRAGSLLEDLVAEHKAAGGINGAGYADDKARGLPAGMLIIDGQVVNRCNSGTRHVMGGFREDNKLVVGAFTEQEIAAQGYRWAFEFGPLLIVNGEKAELNAFSGGLSPRTALGQTADGSVLLLVIDGRQLASIGATYRDLQTILYANGALNAIGLDGGSSSSLVLEGKLINSPAEASNERLIPNAVIF
jgi:exopolysaccharide biosynthesis protein